MLDGASGAGDPSDKVCESFKSDVWKLFRFDVSRNKKRQTINNMQTLPDNN